MFAIVTENLNGRRIRVKKHKDFCVIQIGKKVGKSKLKRVLRRYNNDYIFCENVTQEGFSPFSTKEYKSDVLFALFYKYALRLSSGASVGICDESGRYKQYIPRLTALFKELVLFTKIDTESLLNQCKLVSGTIPRVIKSVTELVECDIVFCHDGLPSFKGRLFGTGGYAIKTGAYILPQFEQVLSLGVNPLDLAAALSFDFKEFEAFKLAERLQLADKF